MKDVTLILEAMHDGKPEAAAQLLPIIYDELRKIAAYKMAAESAGHTLQPTALVHEAWLRLAGSQEGGWENRAHFFAAAAEAMRRILVDHARRKQSLKRGARAQHEPLDESMVELSAPAEEVLAVHAALDELATRDVQAAELVKLRYFVGMTMAEAASALGLPKRTAENVWTYARSWLRRAIRGDIAP